MKREEQLKLESTAKFNSTHGRHNTMPFLQIPQGLIEKVLRNQIGKPVSSKPKIKLLSKVKIKKRTIVTPSGPLS